MVDVSELRSQEALEGVPALTLTGAPLSTPIQMHSNNFSSIVMFYFPGVSFCSKKMPSELEKSKQAGQKSH